MPRSAYLSPFLLLALACPSTARAHELGTIQVFGTFRGDRTYRIDLQVDQEHLKKDQLGGPARRTRHGAISGLPAPVEGRMGRFLSDLVDAATVAFDGKSVEPAVEFVPGESGAAGSPRVVLRLRGPIPGGAHSFTWSAALPIGSYPLVLTSEGDEGSLWKWVEGGKTSEPFPLPERVVPPPRWELARHYLELGFLDILPRGADSVLFVLGLFLLGRRARPLLPQAAAFAAALSVALALAAAGKLALPPRLLAPLLALTLVYVAAGNFVVGTPPPPRVGSFVLSRAVGLMRLAVVSACGLLHGLALAHPLAASQPPPLELPTVLAGFTLGALAAQLTVLAAAFLLLGLGNREETWYRRRVVVPASGLIAAIGSYWFVERLLG
ncbi:MAG TPA: HupE/UreJ family protein [Thermoanaerobaculia bacterium]|nr:HupE/UreJ family protein [Thermoanaerobaculia bacterium]